MRIIGVKFLNLNSLKGEHEIRFDQAPFTESGLFAITGPTGAGKTTILDAITVALYGRVHRLSRDVAEIMSRHTAECYSEVEFEVKGKVYRAKWSLRRSRGKADGNLQGEKMELAEVQTGTFLGGHTPTSVKQAITDAIGLDYNQFLRSVMLSQGDFTRFLKADDNERSELLEKITDTGIYSEVSRYVFERQKAEKEKLDLLQLQVNSVELLSEEVRLIHEKRLLELDAGALQLREKHQAIISRINWLSNLAVLAAKLDGLDKDLLSQEHLFNEKLGDFQRLKLHSRALEFKPALTEIKTVEARSIKLSEDLGELEQGMPALKSEAEQAARTVTETSEALDAAHKNLLEAEPLIEKVILTDASLAGMKSQVDRYKNACEQADTEFIKLAKIKDAKVKELKEIEDTRSSLEVWLTQHKEDSALTSQYTLFRQYLKEFEDVLSAIDTANKDKDILLRLTEEHSSALTGSRNKVAGCEEAIKQSEGEIKNIENKQTATVNERTLEDIEAEASDLPALISLCEQQYRLADSFARLGLTRKELEISLEDQKRTFDREDVLSGQLRLEKEAAEENLRDLRQVVELQQKIQKYEADRQQLKANEPCPLCGSVHHPYAEGHYPGQLSLEEKKREEQERLVADISARFQQKLLDLNTLSLNIQSAEQQLAATEKERTAISSEFQLINNRLPAPLDILKTGTIEAVIRRKKQQLATLQEAIRSVRGLNQSLLAMKNELAARREAKLQAEAEEASLNERLKGLQDQQTLLEKQISSLNDKKEKLFIQLQSLLSPFRIEFDYKQADQIAEDLSKRLEEYDASAGKLQQLGLSHRQVQTELEKTGEALSEKQAQLLRQEKELRQDEEKLNDLQEKRMQMFGDRDPASERERLNKELNRCKTLNVRALHLLQQKQQELKIAESREIQFNADLEKTGLLIQTLKGNLIKKLISNDIASVEVLAGLFIPDSEAEEISGLEREISTRLATLRQLKETTEAEYGMEKAKNLTTESPEALQEELRISEQQISALNQEIGSISRIIEEDNRLKSRFSELSEQISLQQQEAGRWFKLSSLIGSADGRKFSRFAQGLTLARLVDLANRHLLKLSDRYRILKSRERDLELLIVDGYQADVVRPMATLSGGESFLVSLALALGLSDLASRKVQINSLFIDEGFGTLDADTLDVAISALENLQAGGKTIGIISHVEALKERIGTQIRVIRQPGGYSRVKVQSYSGDVFI